MLEKTSRGCFWTNLEALCGSFDKGIFWSFDHVGLLWWSNIMSNLLIKSSFDISLLFKLKYAAISLILWISHIILMHINVILSHINVNKPCSDSLCLPEYTKVIGLKRKRHLLGAEKLKWFLLFSRIDISGKCQ